MKIRPLTILALAALVIVGGMYFLDKGTSSKQTTVATQQITPSPTPIPSPKRELKPNEKFIGPAGLYIQVPENMMFRQENAEERQRTGFYIETSDSSYQLYGVYEGNTTASEKGFEQSKKEIDPATIKEITISGYKGIEGLVIGPKSRYVTFILKEGRLLHISTIPGTQENKEITDQILSTVSFQ